MKISGVIGTTFLSLFLISCKPETSEDIKERVRQALAQGEYQTSIVELKSAVSSYPNDLQLRKLLGRALYTTGDLSGAEKEFEKAGEEDWYLVALYHQGKYEDIVLHYDESSSGHSPLSAFLYKVSLDRIQLDSSNFIDLSPSLSQLYAFYQEGNAERTIENLEKFLSSNDVPSALNEELIILRADILKSEGEYEQAVENLRRLYPNWKRVMRVTYREVDLLLRDAKFDDADIVLEDWLESKVVYPWVNFSKALIEYSKENFSEALLFGQLAIQNGVDSPELYWVTGESAYAAGNKELAFSFFTKAHNANPESIKARTSLARVQLDLGYFDEAISILKDNNFVNDNLGIVKLSSGYLASLGETERAIDLLESAITVNQSNKDLLKQLALLQVRTDEEALSTVRALYNLDNKSVGAAMMLINSYLEMGNVDSANQVAKEFEEVEEETALLMRAMIALKTAKNEKSLELVRTLLTKDSKNVAALRIAMISSYNLKQSDVALDYSKKLLLSSPESRQSAVDYLYMFSEINPLDKKFSKAIDELEGLPNNSVVNLVASKILLERGGNEQALALLNSSEVNTVEHTGLKIKAMLGMGMEDNALQVAISELGESPKTVDAFLMLASVYEKSNNREALLDLVQRTPGEIAKDWRVIIGKFNVLKRAGKLDDAEKELTKLENPRFPTSIFKKFEGELALAKRNFQKARDSFEKSNKLQRDFGTIALMAKASFLDGKVAEAVSMLKQTIYDGTAKTPTELHSVAEFMAITGEIDTADSIYLKLIKNNAEDHAALNNRANILIRKKLYDEAIKESKLAFSIHKNSAYVETLSSAYYHNGEDNKVIEILEKENEGSQLTEAQALLLAKSYVNLANKGKASSLLKDFYERSSNEQKHEWDKLNLR